jgi:hypothetical protein
MPLAEPAPAVRVVEQAPHPAALPGRLFRNSPEARAPQAKGAAVRAEVLAAVVLPDRMGMAALGRRVAVTLQVASAEPAITAAAALEAQEEPGPG